jgi:hypothetical protein
MIGAGENNKKISNYLIYVDRFNRSNGFTIIKIGEI